MSGRATAALALSMLIAVSLIVGNASRLPSSVVSVLMPRADELSQP